MNDVANLRQVNGGGSRARRELTAWQDAPSKASTRVPELNDRQDGGTAEVSEGRSRFM